MSSSHRCVSVVAVVAPAATAAAFVSVDVDLGR